jgi:hypothetical protein
MAIALLTACLALVRPAGMTDSEVEDWLRVAVQTVGQYPPRVLDAACMEARRTCTHFSQIVPAIVSSAEPEMAVLRRMAEWNAPQLAPPKYRLAQEDFEAIVAERGLALSAHLDRGLIVSNGDGTFGLPDEAT